MGKIIEGEIVKKTKISQGMIIIIISIVAIIILAISALNGNEKIPFSPGDCNMTGNGTEICNRIDDNCNNQTDEGIPIVCSNNFQCGNNSTGARYCQNGNVYANVTNYTCIFPGTCLSRCSANSAASKIQTCSSGCLNGNCIQNNSNSCIDTDGGNKPNTKGIASGFLNGISYSKTDVCTANKSLTEYYCLNYKAISTNVTCSSGCSNGACQQNITNTCADTDSGYNPTTKGIASGFLNGISYSKTDVCTANKSLTEYYCLNYKAISTNVTCSSGCSNGACQQNITNTCADTDGGLIWNLKGTVSGKKNGISYSKIDYCQTNKTLLEYYCSGGIYAMNQTYACATTNSSKICSLGACK